MFTFLKPDADFLQKLRAAHHEQSFSYPDVGRTRTDPPPGYVIDYNRILLGSGAATFARARRALCDWQMLRLGWLEPCWPEVPIASGQLVGTLANLFGICRTVNVCRIVYVLDEIGPPARFGFAYGTLTGHLLHGEERFLVEQEAADGPVWFDILAFSRPAHWLSRLGSPVVRGFQRRFARDAKQAMLRATQAGHAAAESFNDCGPDRSA